MAKNSIGESISREARMTVLHANTGNVSPTRPQFVQDPAGHVLHVDDESDFIMMHCVSNGNPRPTVSWRFNNQPLQQSEHVRIYDNGTLVILSPIDEDEGNYKCEASNYLGRVSTIVNYRINGESCFMLPCMSFPIKKLCLNFLFVLFLPLI